LAAACACSATGEPRRFSVLLLLSPQELDKHDVLHRDFWAAALAVASAELYEQQKQEDIDRAK
jgi:hypothetical protein